MDVNAGAFLAERGFVMRNRIDIDSKHSRAIVQEVGERLRAFLQEEPEPPERLERKSTGSANWKSSRHRSFAGTNFAVESPRTAQRPMGAPFQ